MTFAQYLSMRMAQLKRFLLLHKKASVAAIAMLVLIIAALVVWLKPAPAPKTLNDATTVDVTAQAVTTINAQTTVNPADADTTLKWTKSVDITDDDLAIDGTITEEVDENQVFVGDLFLPKGWSAEYSTSPHGTAKADRVFSAYNMTDQASNPLSSITYIRINTGTADGVKPYADSALVRPLDAKQIITDGKSPSAPILFQKKLYVVMKQLRAATAGSYSIDCFDLITYARCVNGSNNSFFPTYFSSVGASATSPTSFGTGTKDVSTPSNMQFVMDDGTYGHNGRVYMPGQVGNSYGVVCFDLASYQNCGFTSLGTAAAPTGTNPSWLNGFVQSGSKIYGHANDPDSGSQTVVCFDIRDPANGGGICSGYNASTVAATQTQYTYEHSNNYDTPGSQVMDGNKMYWTVNYRYGNTRLLGLIFPWDTYPNTQRDLGTVLTCFDVVARTKCAGIYQYNWPRMYDGSGGEVGVEYASAIFMWKQNGSNYAVCYTFSSISLNDSPVESRVLCHSLTDGSFLPGPTPTAPAILPVPSVWQGPTLPGSPAWRMSPNTTTITDTDGHLKTYFAYHYGPTAERGAMSCFDWNTQAHCGQMPWLKYWYNMNNAVSGDEGYAYDGSCMFGVSKQGFLWSFNPKTAESPCRVAGTRYTASINIQDFYCDGQSHPFTWQSARVAKASMYDFQDFNVKVYDSLGGSLLGSGNTKELGKLDLSGPAYSGRSSLYLDVDANVWSGSPWGNQGRPYAKVQANADDVQYCYKTRAKTYVEDIACDTKNLGTSSDAVFNSDDNTFTKTKNSLVPFVQLPNKQCFKDLSVQVTPSVTQINNGDNITYTIAVNNKANPDIHNRGDIGGQYNPKSARIEATIPNGLQFVSASDGGELSGDGSKVVWDTQTILALSTIEPTVTLKAPGPTSANTINPKPVAQLAASQQSNLQMTASAIYDDDVDQSDNTAQNNAVVFENNTSPVLGVLSQTTNNPRAPASLSFVITASDENNFSSLELLSSSDVVGSLQPTGNTNEYGITIQNIPEGNYNFSVRAVDDGTPSLTTTSNTVAVNVAAANAAPVISSFAQTVTSPRYPVTLNFTASVTDDNSVGSVKLYRQGQVVGTFTQSSTPGLYTVALPDYTAGTYVFSVRAEDEDTPKLTTTSSDVTVTIAPNTSPLFSAFSQTVANPRNPATLQFTATVSDDNGLASVALYRGSTQVASMTPTGSPNQYGASVSGLAAGDYSFTARATDNVTPAMSTDSSAVSVTILPNTPPSISGFTQSTNTPRAPATLTFQATVSDNNGVATVGLYSGETYVGAMNPSSSGVYSVSIPNYAAGNYSFSVRATDTATPSLTSESSAIDITVLAPLPPPVVPDPTPPANTAPKVSNFGQTNNKPTEPADLNFVVSVEDDSVIAKVELLEGGQVLGAMSATTTDNEFAYTAKGYKAGDYEFLIRATDDGSPALVTDSEIIKVTVGAPKPVASRTPASTNSTNGSANGSRQKYTPLSIRGAVPSPLVGAVEGTFEVADRAVRPITPNTARVLPYATIVTLAGFAALYVYLASKQAQNRIKIKSVISKYRRTEQGRKEYIDLISHYINTPITTMKAAIELLESKKVVSDSSLIAPKRHIKQLVIQSKALLDDSVAASAEATATSGIINSIGKGSILKSPGFILPVAGVMIIAVVMNLLFIWSKKYDSELINYIAQSSLYVLGAFGLASAYLLLRREQQSAEAVYQELNFEQTIANSQTKFIRNSASSLSDEVTILGSSVSALEKVSDAKIFTDGYNSLEKAVSKFTYLDTLLTTSQRTEEPISLDVSLQVVLSEYQPQAKAKGVSLVVAADPGLSALIDEAGFRQIVGSLLENAITFTPKDGEVRLSIQKSRNKVIIKVQDNGVGISEEKARKLFEPFSRGTDTRTFDYEGLGLDLYMDKLITDKWGGSIKLSSKVNQGTVVTVSLLSPK